MKFLKRLFPIEINVSSCRKELFVYGIVILAAITGHWFFEAIAIGIAIVAFCLAACVVFRKDNVAYNLSMPSTIIAYKVLCFNRMTHVVCTTFFYFNGGMYASGVAYFMAILIMAMVVREKLKTQ